MNVKKFVGICLKRLHSRVMPRNTSEKANMLIYRLTRGQLSTLNAQRSVRGYTRIVNDIQPCPKQCLLMPLALLGARTDAPRVQLQREAWPISAHAHWCAQYVPRFLHFSAFHFCRNGLASPAHTFAALECLSDYTLTFEWAPVGNVSSVENLV